MRSVAFILFLIAMPMLAQVQGVEKPRISVDKMVVGTIVDNVRGTLLIKNITVSGGACYNGAKPTNYSMKIDQLSGEIVNDSNGQRYHLVFLESEWENDTTCNVTMGLRGGPLPIAPHAIRGHAQLAIQAYILCLERSEAFRTKNVEIEVTN